jgi:hypothetical protein
MKRYVIIGLVLVAVLLAGTAAALYFFGTPSAQAVPAPDPSTPLAIEIPGCVCHSKDPKLVKEHAAYRMNQCAGCHAEGVPTGR